ncbi:hypothetical protein NE619_17890 [Anaerovorax odorimutans]|uniref:Bacteriocin n=1 Tax=Anaerovorax odorimutans TaxID=109327 RepID=A0ABT1RU12_9FIRM|nr:hypothetical protein [Anaerovorax odorimutans]MCQ4638604.1 hypothetical protein [Anaerovorax odorimutans]
MANARRGKISKKMREKLDLLCGHNDCKYAATLSGGMCDYLGMVGELRGCPPTKDCDKYESVKGRGK